MLSFTAPILPEPRREANDNSPQGRSVQLEPHRAVVAAHHLRADPRAPERRAKPLGGHAIVDPPPYVPGPAAGHLAPPAVVPRPLLELPERVPEAGVEQPVEALALLVREAGVAPVCPRIRQVDLGVGHVQVAAEQRGLALR